MLKLARKGHSLEGFRAKPLQVLFFVFALNAGDVPLEIQPKLLRALQEREFERLGSTRTKKVDVRNKA